MPNYQETGECYIGSTCQPTLAKRLSGHVIQLNVENQVNELN